MSEHWLPVVGWEDYEVSNLGNVRSVDRTILRSKRSMTLQGKVLAKAGATYHVVTLGDGARRQVVYVHTLVLTAFVGPRPQGAVSCHGPGGPLDNRVTNLRWDTPRENNLDQVRTGTHGMSCKVYCKRGHALVSPNLRAGPPGQRHCLACHNARSRITRTGQGSMDVLANSYYSRLVSAHPYMVTGEDGATVWDNYAEKGRLALEAGTS